MKQDRSIHTTKPAESGNPATLGRLEAVLARHAAELRAMADTPLQRALVARAAALAIKRAMTAEAVA